jgi:hypothetical protein
MWGLLQRIFIFGFTSQYDTSLCGHSTVSDSVSDTCPGNAGAAPSIKHHKIVTLYSPVVAICTTNLTFSNSTLGPHSVFMCFVWIWEQKDIISPYNINP